MKSLELSPELQPVLARWLGSQVDVDRYRVQAPAGAPEGWQGLVEEIGVLGLLVEEEHGGQGAGVPELAAALLEAGRAGWSGPLVSVAGVTVELLRRLDPNDAQGLRAVLAEGEVVVVAATERPDAADVTTCATTVDAAGRLGGVKTFVDGGVHATRLLVHAAGPGGPEIRLVRTGDPGVTVEPMESVDPARGLARVRFDGADSVAVAAGATVAEALDAAWRLGALLGAADAVGIATRVLELSVEYAGTRQQFGRTIGSFQAVKHLCVDMYAELETANSALRAAVTALDEESPRARFAVAAAKARGCDAAMAVVRHGVQVHGGIGFTWEHPMSHHFRRATLARQMYGTPAAHRRVVAQEVGL